MEQGWLLVTLTSIVTFLGCCVIYVDEIYSWLFPKIAAKKPFKIANDANFLICSLSLSSGCLLLTSLYRLLPEAHHYLKKIPQFVENPHLLKITEYSSFLGGIIACSLMNMLVHLFTNESLVHCAHDAPSDTHDEGHEHSHADSLDENSEAKVKNHTHSHSGESDHHSHSQPNSESTLSLDYEHAKLNSLQTLTKVPPPKVQSEAPVKIPEHIHVSATSPYPHGATPRKKLSLVDLSLKTLKGETMTGPCYGDIDCCPEDILTENKLHKHNSNELYYCSKPTEENLLFFPKEDHMITDKAEFASRYPNLDIQSPLISNEHNSLDKNYKAISHHHTAQPIVRNYSHAYSVHNEPRIPEMETVDNFDDNDNDNIDGCDSAIESEDEHTNGRGHSHDHHHDHHHDHSHDHGHDHHDESTHLLAHEGDIENQIHQQHEHDHHHHIKTPLSRLLSIGLQTILAIALHKFPEGFIMYSTSKTNPALGMSIFLSMFIHNFVEGFTMTLPIYIALNSRAKALLIAGPLGSLSQPLGALIGYWLFRGNMDMDDPHSIMVIGVLLSITAGFLTFISLQMFASSIAFGGKQEKVLKWCFFGIFLICFSDLLT